MASGPDARRLRLESRYEIGLGIDAPGASKLNELVRQQRNKLVGLANVRVESRDPWYNNWWLSQRQVDGPN